MIKRKIYIKYIMNVIINGSKTNFISKNAVMRLKKDIMNLVSMNQDITLTNFEYQKYLKEDFCFYFDKRDLSHTDITVNIIDKKTLDEKNKLEKMVKDKEEKKLQLKTLLKDTIKDRSGQARRDLLKIKKAVPSNIFDTYHNIVTKYKLDNLPAPDEVINNVEKYRLQISTVMGLGNNLSKLSNIPAVSSSVKKYFTELGTYLNIEPLTIDLDRLKLQENIAKNNSDTESDSDDGIDMK
jgi:hypothetical protein